MEMMDRLAIEAAEAFVKVGYPLDVEALLIVELDGVGAECDHLIDEVTRIAEANGSTTLSASRDEAERLAFWAGRKAAFPAVGRISPDYYCMDGTIPRRRQIGKASCREEWVSTCHYRGWPDQSKKKSKEETKKITNKAQT